MFILSKEESKEEMEKEESKDEMENKHSNKWKPGDLVSFIHPTQNKIVNGVLTKKSEELFMIATQKNIYEVHPLYILSKKYKKNKEAEQIKAQRQTRLLLFRMQEHLKKRFKEIEKNLSNYRH
jgi:hypothetical protein